MKSPLRHLGVIFTILLSFLMSACTGGTSSALAGGSVATGSVAGRVVDTSGTPMAGALAKACDPSGASLGEVVTGSTGIFSLDVPVGLVDVAIKIGDDPVYQATVLVVEDQTLDLGDVTVDASLADWDGDGLPDALENEGWTITLDLDGYDQLVTKTVASSPYSADTDGDGLDDAAEFASRIDPTRADTDGDALSDLDEMTMYKSNPSDVDTDGDARGPLGTAQPNPSLFDGQELSLSGTSPTLADTDGDGLTDYEEILGGGFNPRIADLPQLALELNGDPSLTLNAEKTQTQEAVSATSTLQRDQTEQTKTDAATTQVAVENSTTIKTEAEVAFPAAAKVNVSGEMQFKESFSQETSSSWSDSSVQETQAEYSSSFDTGEELTFKDGEILQALKFVNQSERTFLMKDMKVIAFRLDPLNPGSFQAVGTLAPSAGDLPEEGLVLAPGGEATFIAQNDEVNWQAMQPLMKNPSSLFYEVGSYSIFETDETGAATKNFAVTGQDVTERCGLIVVDFGDGRVERYSVATNVERNPDGSSKGVTLGKALGEIIQLPFGTEPDGTTGELVLTSVRDQSAFIDAVDPNVLGFWAIAGGGDQFSPVSLDDFEDIILNSGQRITLMYLTDTDGDGLYDREEEAWGTSKLTGDTDLDGLGDNDEVNVGWDVEFVDGQGVVLPQYTYHAFPNPKLVDSDFDGLDDIDEQAAGTDPREVDTDGDGVQDNVDPSPLDAPGAPGNIEFGNLAFYDLAQDFTDSSTHGNDASATKYTPGAYPGGGPHNDGFWDGADHFGTADKAMYLANVYDSENSMPVMSTPPLDLSTSYSFSAWVDPTPGHPQRFIMGHEGASFSVDEALGLNDAGGSLQPFYRVPLASGGHYQMNSAVTIPFDDWTHLVVTVFTNASGSTISLYVNGALVQAEGTPSPIASVGSASVRVGTPGTHPGYASNRFMGGLDDLRIYQKAIDATTVLNLFHDGGF